MTVDPADPRASVSLIPDGFSALTDGEYAEALAEWLAEGAPGDPVKVAVPAAEALHDIRVTEGCDQPDRGQFVDWRGDRG